MIPLQVVALLLVAAGGTAVVLARDTLRQAIVNGVYGLLLTALLFVLQAPDVALSMLVVGSIAYPLVLVAAIVKARARQDGDGKE
jgi:energy-converting hydrogenase B subunit D